MLDGGLFTGLFVRNIVSTATRYCKLPVTTFVCLLAVGASRSIERHCGKQSSGSVSCYKRGICSCRRTWFRMELSTLTLQLIYYPIFYWISGVSQSRSEPCGKWTSKSRTVYISRTQWTVSTWTFVNLERQFGLKWLIY